MTPEQALAICCDVGAANYVETSAVTSEVNEAFEVAGLAFMKTLQRYSTSCSQHSSNSGEWLYSKIHKCHFTRLKS